MFNLVITVITIALITLVLMAGVGIINFSSIIRITESIDIEKKINKIESLVSSYQIKFDSYPTNNTVLSNYIKDEFRQGSQSISEVSIFGENLYFDSTFNMLSNSNSYPVEICFGSETLTENQYNSIVKIKESLLRKNFTDSKMNISDQCGLLTDSSFTDFPEKIWITYRIN